jgi:hypothetical protein
MNDATADEPKSSRAPKTVSEARSPDEWATSKGTVAWALAGAKQAKRDHWVIGRLVTEAEFDAEINRVVNMPFGSPARPVKPRSKRGRR